MHVGFLFSDIENSTERWERAPNRMRAAVERHNHMVDELIPKWGGAIHDRAGDGVFAVFKAGSPLDCALEMQLAMQDHDWSDVGGLDVRIGVHIGHSSDQAPIDQAAVNRAARITACGWGGQIVVSEQAALVYAPPPLANFVDLGVCQLRGLSDPLRLHSLIHPLLRKRDFPPPRTDALQAVDIPNSAGPLFGRERELNDLRIALKTTRLLTLVGAGGSGKTRLAVQLASEVARVQAVVFVSLDHLQMETELSSVIAHALRLPFHGASPHEEQLADYLRARRVLLVLDNADVIAGRASFLAALAASCPGVAILATSREPLRVAGESLYRLSGLAVAEEDDEATSPAYLLFAYEARTLGSEVALTAEQLAHFREICSIVNSSPLALRLLARWSRVLSLEDMLEQLRTGPAILSQVSGSESSLGGVFEGSWTLLNSAQRAALARLSVFAGPFDWNAAKMVADVEMPVYAALAEKSLLEESTRHRSSIHPLIRHHARAKLAADPKDEANTLKRHSDFYLNMIGAVLQNSPNPRWDTAVEVMQGDFANISLAWWYANHIGSDRVQPAAEALRYLLDACSMHREAIRAFGVETSDQAAALLFRGIQANFMIQQGDLEDAEVAARGVFSARGSALARGYARHALGNLAHVRGDYVGARLHYERALALRRRTGHIMGCSYSALSLAALLMTNNRQGEAGEYIKQGFRFSRQAGNAAGVITAHVLAGDLALWEGRTNVARTNYERALSVEQTSRTAQSRASILRRLGSLLLHLDDPAGALEQHRRALELATEIGDQRTRVLALTETGEDLRRLGDLDGARTVLLEAVRLSLSLRAQPQTTRSLIELALTEFEGGAKHNAELIAGVMAGLPLQDQRAAYEALIERLDIEAIESVAQLSIEDVLDNIADEAALGLAN